jgi:hypothetical protein
MKKNISDFKNFVHHLSETVLVVIDKDPKSLDCIYHFDFTYLYC